MPMSMSSVNVENKNQNNLLVYNDNLVTNKLQIII